MNATPASTSRKSAAIGWSFFIGSAGLVAGLLLLGWDHPWFGILALLVVGGVAIPALRAKQRFRQLMMLGELDSLLALWTEQTKGHASQLDPLFKATAQLSFGLTERAEHSLRFVRTQALSQGDKEAAIEIDEQLLFVRAVLAAFEGENDRASEHVEQLNHLPLPGSRWTRGKAITLRRAAAALVRAFAEGGNKKDVSWLRMAARQNPLVVWPMHYAEAVIQLQLGELDRTRHLLKETPEWPPDSVFRSFDRELNTKMQQIGAAA